ncbi:hypothetical protein KHS38_06500 [Mucilaginibacter sp. Bleaf8]|uniref:hypothetical protein n=1 Tax=Mucilaginibacter sp. Bleaf8 TaxID=2834430 RepID=UPI001BCCE683|nr:hypothetical protein [Mucilaginibacter sp. Bleaf8]MBS7564051.1 hypothetical protein [Mucilaginibacter sp. Bleaf8]
MYKPLFGAILLTSCIYTAFGQTVTDSTMARSPIKTLTLKQYSDFMKGPDLLDMALPATMNHYPMPDDVLRYKKELGLSASQVQKVKSISDYLQLKKKEIGQSVVRNEKKLDELFSTKKLNEGDITFYGNRYGLYEGEYRTSVLTACYNTYNVLTPQQTTRFWQLKNHN